MLHHYIVNSWLFCVIKREHKDCKKKIVGNMCRQKVVERLSSVV